MSTRRRSVLTEEELLLLAEVAQLYYVGDFTQERIARRVGTSRSNVSRMLKEAREQGLVEIKVRSPLSTVPELQDTLKAFTGLKECYVLSTSDHWSRFSQSDSLERKMGALAARCLQENVTEDNIVGVGWSSTVYHHVVNSGYLHEKRGVTVVQLMGSVGDSIPELNGLHIAARLAAALSARAHYLYAPVLVSDVAVRDALLCDQSIRKTLGMAQRADVMIAGVGAVDREAGQYRTGYLNDADLDYIRGQGAIGDVCGSYFSRDGSFCPIEMNERTIALDFESMLNIPTRIGVSYGVKKALANIGAARSGLLNTLITDEEAARQMLSLLKSEDASMDAAATRTDGGA